MIKSINDITTDNLKNILKIVVIGFITLDFFSPLTFRFIASFFSEGHEMKWAFIVFRVVYLSSPLLLVLISLIHNNRFSKLINYYDVLEFKNTLVYLYITSFCIIFFIILSLSAFVVLDFLAADVIKASC